MTVIYTPVTYTIDTNDLKTNPLTDLFIKSVYYPRTITMPLTENLNYNPSIHKRVVKYFYYKTLENWIYDDSEMTKLLNYFIIDKNKVTLVSSQAEYEKRKNKLLSESEKKIIVEFISNYVLTQNKMEDFINKFISRMKIPLIHLYRNQRKVRHFITRRLRKKLEKTVQ